MEPHIVHSEIYIQVVMAVSTRRCLIKPAWEAALYKYLTERAALKRCPVMAIGGAEDHVHVLLSMHPDVVLDELIKDLKRSSNEFINAGGYLRSYFSWQENYGAFSYGRWDVPSVKKFIADQKLQHKRISFREEFLQLLKENGIEADGRKAFRWVSETASQVF